MWSLLGVGHDEAGASEVPADGGGGDGDAMVMGEVPGDGVRAGVEALCGELLA